MRAIFALTFGLAVAGLLTTASAQQRRNIFADPQNLQVLPADISTRELSQTMRGFALGLGVRCQHCHVGEAGQPLSEFDFPADVKAPKMVAREMLKMVAGINATTAAVANRFDRPATEVRCVTCHRGQSRPQLIEDVLNETLESGDGAAAVEKYKVLREEFYGGHTYDFSELTLSMYADGLFRGGKRDAAIGLHLMNREYHPESAMAHVYLGGSYQAMDELEKAAEYYRKALEINPEFRFAQGRLKAVEEQLKAKKPESKPE